MSLIQAIITDKYAMLCSDTKAYTLSGTHVDNCRKIIPIGDGIMFGCTGKVSDNYELFEDYCECDGVRFSSRNFETSLSYNKVIKRLTSKYDKLERKFNAGKKYEICSIVCGYNDEKERFETIIFALHHDRRIKNGIFFYHQSIRSPYKITTCGNIYHHATLDNLAEDTYYDCGDEVTIRQWKNMFQDVLDDGITFDHTINDRADFVTIRKVRNADGTIRLKCSK